MSLAKSIWHGRARQRKRKRQDNLDKSIQILRGLNIPFESKQNNTYLIVRYQGRVVDFWPMAGTWRNKNSPDKSEHRGIFTLLNSFGISTEKKDYGNHYPNPR